MALPQGISFGNSLTQPTNYDYDNNGVNATYPHTSAQGNTVGWEQAVQCYFRNSMADVRLKGHAYNPRSNAYDFRIDLPAPGSYNIRAAMSDTFPVPARLRIVDNTTVLVDRDAGSVPSNQIADATGVIRTSEADFVANNALQPATFSTTIARFRFGQSVSTADSNWKANFIYIEAAAGGTNATATPSGVSASSAVGSATASGQAKASPSGVAATAAVGTATVTGQGLASPAGVGASAAVGAAIASGQGKAAPLGVSASASVGAAVAQGTTSSTAQPAGVAASAGVGTASASGQGKAAPAGVSATAAVGTAAATGQAIAAPSGVSAAAAVGTATASGAASSTAQPAGVSVLASIGLPIASGSAAAAPAGVAAVAAIGIVVASGTAITNAFPAGVSATASVGVAAVSASARAAPAGVMAYAYVGTATAYDGSVITLLVNSKHLYTGMQRTRAIAGQTRTRTM